MQEKVPVTINFIAEQFEELARDAKEEGKTPQEWVAEAFGWRKSIHEVIYHEKADLYAIKKGWRGWRRKLHTSEEVSLLRPKNVIYLSTQSLKLNFLTEDYEKLETDAQEENISTKEWLASSLGWKKELHNLMHHQKADIYKVKDGYRQQLIPTGESALLPANAIIFPRRPTKQR